MAVSTAPLSQQVAVGINRGVLGDGSVEVRGHIGQTEMAPGDVFEILTPGGGGYGPVQG